MTCCQTDYSRNMRTYKQNEKKQTKQQQKCQIQGHKAVT